MTTINPLNRIAGELTNTIRCYHAKRSVINRLRELELVEMILLSGKDVSKPLQWLIKAVGSSDWDEENPHALDVRRTWLHACIALNENDVIPSYAIYHATSPLAMLWPEPRDWQVNRDQHYRHIADVRAERDQIFSLTNHDEGQDWTNRPEVSLVVSGVPLRSTSVGDVILDYQTSRAWLVGRSGLEEIC